MLKQQLGGICATETTFREGNTHEVPALWTSGYVNTTSLCPKLLKPMLMYYNNRKNNVGCCSGLGFCVTPENLYAEWAAAVRGGSGCLHIGKGLWP